VSKKTDLVAKLLQEVQLRHPVPSAAREGLTLLEQGAVLVLMRHQTQKQAEASVEALRVAFDDWNEVRVSQYQEIAGHLKTSSRKKGAALLRDLTPAARALKDYLQDVFQNTHGLDLEFLREDIPAAGKAIAQLGELGLTAGSFLLWIAGGGEVPVHMALVRMLHRLDLCPNTQSVRRASEAILPLVPTGHALAFTLCFHEILARWTDPDEPIFVSVTALRETPAGSKAYQSRQTQLEREEVRRKKEEARRLAQEKREAERLAREEERARKRAEAEAKRKARELERRRRVDARKREQERKRREAERKKAAEKKQAELRRKAEAKKKAAAKKKAEAKRKADAKKKAEAKKKAAAKKKAEAKKKAAAKKKPAKRATKKKSSSSRGSAKKGSKKKAAKKAPARKPPRRR